MQWVNISNVIWYFSWSLWCLGLPVVTTLHLLVSMERYLSGRWQHKQLLKGLGSNNRSVWKDAPSDLLGMDSKIILSNCFVFPGAI